MSLLKSFDIFQAAGGPDIGIATDFPVTADGNGNVAVLFSPVVDNPKVSGVELYQAVPLPQPPPDFTIDLDTSAITLSPASGNVPGGGLSESMVTAIPLNGETALHRQIDKAVRLLGRDVPRLFEGRARKQALADLDQTERSCRTDLEADLDVALRANDYLKFCPVQNLDYERLDNLHSVPSALVNDEAPAPAQPQPSPHVQNCQNELPDVQDTAPPEKQPLKTRRTCGRKALAPARSRAMALRLPKKKPKQAAELV